MIHTYSMVAGVYNSAIHSEYDDSPAKWCNSYHTFSIYSVYAPIVPPAVSSRGIPTAPTQGKQLEQMKDAYYLAIELPDDANGAADSGGVAPSATTGSTLEEVSSGTTPPPPTRPPLSASATAARREYSRQVSGLGLVRGGEDEGRGEMVAEEEGAARSNGAHDDAEVRGWAGCRVDGRWTVQSTCADVCCARFVDVKGAREGGGEGSCRARFRAIDLVCVFDRTSFEL